MEEIRILNREFFGTLTENEQGLFLAHRNSMLVIFPKENNTYDDEILTIVEESAKIFVSTIPDIIKNPPPPMAATTTI